MGSVSDLSLVNALFRGDCGLAHAPLTVPEAAVVRDDKTYDWRRRTEDFRRERRVVERPFPAHFRASQRPLPAMRAGVATPGHRRTPGSRGGGEGEGRP